MDTFGFFADSSRMTSGMIVDARTGSVETVRCSLYRVANLFRRAFDSLHAEKCSLHNRVKAHALSGGRDPPCRAMKYRKAYRGFQVCN